MNTDYIEQTAKDFDVEFEIAKWIYEKDPEHFIDNMEEFIKERAAT